LNDGLTYLDDGLLRERWSVKPIMTVAFDFLTSSTSSLEVLEQQNTTDEEC
jgi:hypothetical protein